jgi:hypothetical protein
MCKYEIVIPTASKDTNKVPYAIQSALQYLNPKPQQIHIIASPIAYGHLLTNKNLDDVEIHREDIVVPLDPTLSRFRRPQWVYQQFIKLFNDVTDTDDYLVVDSDIIFNRPINIYSADSKPFFFLNSINHNHEPDFALLQKLFGFGREYPHTFTVEFMLIRKHIRNSIYKKWGTIKNLYKEVCSLITHDGRPYRMNDYETYGQFTYVNFPNHYDFINIRSKLFHKYGVDWAPEEIEELISKMGPESVDVFTYHTWI